MLLVVVLLVGVAEAHFKALSLGVQGLSSGSLSIGVRLRVRVLICGRLVRD